MNPLEFLQKNVFYTPERKQEINESLRRTQMLAPNTPTPGRPNQTTNGASLGSKLSPAEKARRIQAASPGAMAGSTGNFLQDNIFYTPERKQEINNSLMETQSRNPAMPKPVPELPGGTGNFIQDNIFYTPERKAAINNSLVETQKKNPALTRSTPADAVESAARGLASGFAGKPIPKNPELKYTPSGTDSALRSLENEIGKYVPDFLKDLGRDAEKKGLGGLIPGAGLLLPDQKPLIKPESKKPRFADLRGSETPGSMTPAADNSAADKAFSDAATFQAGTDTGSGNREVTRVAQTDNMDDNMRAWAAANPELAKRMVAKQDRRLETNPDFKQSGYEAVRNELYPERAALAAEQERRSMDGFSARDAVGGGMSAQNAINIASGGSVETLIDGDKATQVSSSPGKAKALAESYKKSIIGAPAEALPPSATQNPQPMGGDGTPIDSEPELRKATTPLKDRFTLTPDEVGAAINAGNLDQQLSRLGRRM